MTRCAEAFCASKLAGFGEVKGGDRKLPLTVRASPGKATAPGARRGSAVPLNVGGDFARLSAVGAELPPVDPSAPMLVGLASVLEVFLSLLRAAVRSTSSLFTAGLPDACEFGVRPGSTVTAGDEPADIFSYAAIRERIPDAADMI